MRKLVFFTVFCVLLSGRVFAASTEQIMQDEFGVDTFYDAVEKVLDQSIDPENLVFGDGMFDILEKSTLESAGFLRKSTSVMVRMLLILILCQLAESLGPDYRKPIVSLTGVLSLTVCSFGDVHSLIGLGERTLQEISSFSTLLLPVMGAVSAASGTAGSSGAMYAVTMLFSDLLLRLGNAVIIPMVYAYIGLAAADPILGEEKLKSLRSKLGWLLEWSLKGLVYAFIGCLTITGTAAASTDSAVLKVAKTTISSFVPVVGGIIAGAAETVLHTASLMKQTVGTLGMLSVLTIFATPFLQIGISYLMLKLTAALSGTLGSHLTGLLEGIAGGLGYILALTGSSVMIVLISCCGMLKVVYI